MRAIIKVITVPTNLGKNSDIPNNTSTKNNPFIYFGLK
jgi:hypothetical protein